MRLKAAHTDGRHDLRLRSPGIAD